MTLAHVLRFLPNLSRSNASRSISWNIRIQLFGDGKEQARFHIFKLTQTNQLFIKKETAGSNEQMRHGHDYEASTHGEEGGRGRGTHHMSRMVLAVTPCMAAIRALCGAIASRPSTSQHTTIRAHKRTVLTADTTAWDPLRPEIRYGRGLRRGWGSLGGHLRVCLSGLRSPGSGPRTHGVDGARGLPPWPRPCAVRHQRIVIVDDCILRCRSLLQARLPRPALGVQYTC